MTHLLYEQLSSFTGTFFWNKVNVHPYKATQAVLSHSKYG